MRENFTNFTAADIDTNDIEHPKNLEFGDYSFTKLIKILAKVKKDNPDSFKNVENITDTQKSLIAVMNSKKPTEIEKIEIVGPGFINFYLSKEFFVNSIKEIHDVEKWGSNSFSSGKKVMVEYTDPNPFKPFHIGHLMTNAIGESVARIFEYSGADVIRANYQGDVGLHVAKAIYGIIKNQSGLDHIKKQSVEFQATFIGEQYSWASGEYDDLPEAKAEIDAINKKVYERSDSEINEIYDWGRKVTLEAFETLYKTLGTKFSPNCYFFESIMAPIGKKVVEENIGKVFEESDGAVVFKAENYNPKLHTRVFITKQGLPTYEAKEIGLTITKFKQENPDTSIVVTAIEQGRYMEVVQKAISLIHPNYESRMKHVTHGMMRFSNGKMSSRKGNVITGESLLNDSYELVYEKLADRGFSENQKDTIAHQIGVAAIKFTILKQALGGNIIYDEEKSLSFEGDSGPYVQYSLVRAYSVLEKGDREIAFKNLNINIQPKADWETITLEKYLYRFPEIVERSYKELEPHHIATYLLEICSAFNSFYSQQQIVEISDHKASQYRLLIVKSFIETAKAGLYLLGISVPEKM